MKGSFDDGKYAKAIMFKSNYCGAGVSLHYGQGRALTWQRMIVEYCSGGIWMVAIAFFSLYAFSFFYRCYKGTVSLFKF
jgi:hypothetical protein